MHVRSEWACIIKNLVVIILVEYFGQGGVGFKGFSRSGEKL